MLKIAIEKGWNGRITISHGSDFDASRSLAAKIGFVKITSDSVFFDEYEYSPETNI
ncbi:MAG: hypothetical protein IPN13_17420 [Bacteroidetes bacterium]|nr:hypothetical protein [Bacteroidota bacterium]